MPDTHRGQKAALDSPGARITDGLEQLCGCRESNLDPLEDERVLFIAEPSLHPPAGS